MAIQSIIGMIVNAAARNMKQTGEGRNQAGSGYNVDALKKQQGMQTQSFAPVANNAQSPTAQLTQFATGMSPQMQEQSPIGSALKGEKTMLQNQNTPLVGGYSVGNINEFDSGQPYYRKLPRYGAY